MCDGRRRLQLSMKCLNLILAFSITISKIVTGMFAVLMVFSHNTDCSCLMVVLAWPKWIFDSVSIFPSFVIVNVSNC